MSEVTENAEATEPTAEEQELALLVKRANQMGLKYHHKTATSLSRMRELVNGALNGQGVTEAPAEEEAEPIRTAPHKETEAQRRKRMRQEANKLVRIRVACMNPNKKEWEGEIFTVSNGVVGTFKKYVPFNAEQGWHVPQIILNHMQERKCQIFYTVRNKRGQKIRKGKLIKELNIEILPPLTPTELQKLAQRQAMAAGEVD